MAAVDCEAEARKSSPGKKALGEARVLRRQDERPRAVGSLDPRHRPPPIAGPGSERPERARSGPEARDAKKRDAALRRHSTRFGGRGDGAARRGG